MPGPPRQAAFDPAAEGWTVDPWDRFISHVGPVWRKTVEGRRDVGFIAADQHLNPNGFVHGGMLVTLLDHVVGLACFDAAGADAALSTIQISTMLMRHAERGDFVTARAHVVRMTRSLIFVRAECIVGSEVILAGEVTVKRLRKETLMPGGARQNEGAPST